MDGSLSQSFNLDFLSTQSNMTTKLRDCKTYEETDLSYCMRPRASDSIYHQLELISNHNFNLTQVSMLLLRIDYSTFRRFSH